MLLEIVQLGDPVLREKCADVNEVSDEIVALAEDMLETMYHAHGVGLAAPASRQGAAHGGDRCRS